MTQNILCNAGERAVHLEVLCSRQGTQVALDPTGQECRQRRAPQFLLLVCFSDPTDSCFGLFWTSTVGLDKLFFFFYIPIILFFIFQWLHLLFFLPYLLFLIMLIYLFNSLVPRLPPTCTRENKRIKLGRGGGVFSRVHVGGAWERGYGYIV